MPDGTRQRITLLHISDLHFGDEDPNKMKALLDLAELCQPDLLCVTGDVVDNPLWPKNFKKARKFLDSVRERCSNREYVVPGNHDALLRSLSLMLFRRHITTQTEFGKVLELGGIDICVFGVDSTCFSLRQANNAGAFSSKSRRALNNAIGESKVKLGIQRYKRAFKICLVHHHPLPTTASAAEGMLYFKNCGTFLNTAAEEGFDLILHGHRHEPTYFSINYNRVGEERAMMVLSAGTATKRIDATDGICRQTQVHLVEFYRKSIVVNCYNYDYWTNEFWQSRMISCLRVRSDIAERKIHYRYKADSIWNMTVEERLYLATVSGKELAEILIEIAVDDKTPECLDFDRLRVKLWQDDDPLPDDSYVIARNDPRDKMIAVKLPRPASYAGTNIRCSYEWPGGFRNLGLDGKDVGIFPMQMNVDELKVELEIEAPDRPIRDFRVRYHGPFKELPTSDPQRRRGFLIEKPAHSWTALFEVWT